MSDVSPPNRVSPARWRDCNVGARPSNTNMAYRKKLPRAGGEVLSAASICVYCTDGPQQVGRLTGRAWAGEAARSGRIEAQSWRRFLVNGETVFGDFSLIVVGGSGDG